MSPRRDEPGAPRLRSLVGCRPEGDLIDWLAAAGLALLSILGITHLFAAIGVVSSSPDAAMGYGFILRFLPCISSALVMGSPLGTEGWGRRWMV